MPTVDLAKMDDVSYTTNHALIRMRERFAVFQDMSDPELKELILNHVKTAEEVTVAKDGSAQVRTTVVHKKLKDVDAVCVFIVNFSDWPGATDRGVITVLTEEQAQKQFGDTNGVAHRRTHNITIAPESTSVSLTFRMTQEEMHLISSGRARVAQLSGAPIPEDAKFSFLVGESDADTLMVCVEYLIEK